MGSVNKVILVGNLGRDAETRYTASGTAVLSFSMATTEKWTGKDGEKREQTEWHNVSLFGKVAEAVGQYLSKGKQVYIEGKLKTEEWNDKKTGEKRKATKVVADRIVLLGGGGDGAGRRRETRREDDDVVDDAVEPADTALPPDESDIPF